VGLSSVGDSGTAPGRSNGKLPRLTATPLSVAADAVDSRDVDNDIAGDGSGDASDHRGSFATPSPSPRDDGVRGVPQKLDARRGALVSESGPSTTLPSSAHTSASAGGTTPPSRSSTSSMHARDGAVTRGTPVCDSGGTTAVRKDTVLRGLTAGVTGGRPSDGRRVASVASTDTAAVLVDLTPSTPPPGSTPLPSPTTAPRPPFTTPGTPLNLLPR
jgi:hypothetical protein